MIGAIKVERVSKTKFRKRDDERNDYNTTGGRKKKHHDKSYYRLAKEEENDYEFDTYDKKGNRTT